MQLELDDGDDLTGAKRRVTIGELELVRPEPLLVVGVDHERSPDDARPVVTVGSSVHLYAAPRRSGDGAGNLEPAEPGCARAVETDRVGGAPACDEQLFPNGNLRELAGQTHDERVDARVGGEQVRTEPDRNHGQLTLVR